MNPSKKKKVFRRPDEFLTALRKFFDQLAKHSRAVAAAFAVILLLGIVGAIASGRQAEKEGKARDALFLARQSLETELTAIAKSEAPKPVAPKADSKKAPAEATPEATAESIRFKPLDVDARLAEPVKKLKAISEEWGKTRAGFESRLILGDLYYRHGQPEKSVSWYDQAAKSAPENFDKALAYYSLGYAQERLNKPAEAVEAYDSALKLGDVGLKGDLLLALARAHLAQGKADRAKEAYEKVLKELPGSEYAKSAESLKAKLGKS